MTLEQLERRLERAGSTRAARVAGWCAVAGWCMYVAVQLVPYALP